MTKRICRLCAEVEPNVEAHILPEGLMKLAHSKPKYDGRFLMLRDGKPPVNRPTGSYDKNILCQKCDNKIGVYDLEAIKFCQRKDLAPYKTKSVFALDNVNQSKLKLFAISYLWRASITQMEDYSGISLGDKHEAQMREMILNNNAGSIDDYSVLVSRCTLPANRRKWGMHIFNPVRNRLSGINTYEVYLPNLYDLWLKVDQRPFADNLATMSLGAQQQVIIFTLGDYTQFPEFSIARKYILQAGKNRGSFGQYQT